MRKSFQKGKTSSGKVRVSGKLILRLMLAAVIGLFTGKLLLSNKRPEPQDTEVAMTEHQAKAPRSSRRVEIEAKSKASAATFEPADSYLPSPGSRAYLSLIKRLPTLDSREFFKLAQQPGGGVTLQQAVLGEWAKRNPKEMFETLHAAFSIWRSILRAGGRTKCGPD